VFCCFSLDYLLLRPSQFLFCLQSKRASFAALLINVKFLRYDDAVSQRRRSSNYAFTSSFSYFYTLRGFWPSPSPDFIPFIGYSHQTLRRNHKVVLYSTKNITLKIVTSLPNCHLRTLKCAPPPAPGSVASSDVSVVRISAKLFRLVQTSKCVRTNTELVSKPCTFPFNENSGPASDRI